MLTDRTALLILDNCEHVIEDAAGLADDLLATTPQLRLLATSREALRVPGEVVWRVPPLDPADAVMLFAERARAASPTFELTDDGRAVVATLCDRVDGLPLAIELTAARSSAFTVEQLAERLEDRFRLLTTGARTALPRHQTLRAVTDWSYDLLFDEERAVFERDRKPRGETLVVSDNTVGPNRRGLAMGFEGWSLVACVVFAGLWSGLLSMLTLVMHRMVAQMGGGEFARFQGAFLPVARKAWFNYFEVAGMIVAPVVALVALGTAAGAAFVLTAVGLVLTMVGPLLVSNRLAEPNYDVILGWDPDAVPADWLATRHRYFTYNWVRFAITCAAFAVFLAALVQHLR